VFADPAKFRAKGGEVEAGEQVAGEAEVVRDHDFGEFAPYELAQFAGVPRRRFEMFDDAVDEYFARLEEQKAMQQHQKQEVVVNKKVQKLKSELDSRVADLQQAQITYQQKAELIEYNSQEVEAAIVVTSSAVASALDWDDLARMVKQEKRNGNPIAQIIHSLQLDKNEITLLLNTNALHDVGEEYLAEDYSADASPSILVEVDLGMSAHSNARKYYEMKKQAAAKETKAVEASSKAMKVAEVKAKKDLKNAEASSAKSIIKEMRKHFWFEKFLWFISSENYLVVAGRDAQQNEILVKRYLGPDDVYIHAEIHGAASVIVKNKPRVDGVAKPLPPLTLSEAGNYAICMSSGWDSKILTSAWWVSAAQVSKHAPTGEYVGTGSFVIRGKKNFLPPAQLVMGLGILFRIDESCLVNHKNERTVRSLGDDDGEGDGVELDAGKKYEIKGTQKEVHVVEAPAKKKTMAASGGGGPVDERPEDAVSNVTLEESVGDEALQKATQPSNVLEEYIRLKSKEAAQNAAPVNVEEEREDATDETHNADQKKEGKKHLSAKQRRMLKKGTTSAAPNGDDTSSSESDDEPPSNLSSEQAPAKVKNAPRGKRNKLKRMKKKYAEQGDAEREVALAILGSKKIKEEEDDAEREGGAKEANETGDGDDAKKPDGQKRFVDKRALRQEKAAIKQILEEEGVSELSEAELDAMSSLDRLISQPRADDILQFAVPVCAPYSVIISYKYKVRWIRGLRTHLSAVN